MDADLRQLPSTELRHADRPTANALFQLRFESLFDPGRGLVFPCDERGQVELDALSKPARRIYFDARAVVGREFATPRVMRSGG